jgi:phosphomannomutase/phosphoglucomutase
VAGSLGVQVDSVEGPAQMPELSAGAAEPDGARQGEVSSTVPAEIFRAYDIRGIVGRDLTPSLMRDIGRAVGTEASAVGDKTVIVGRDTRLSGPELSEALMEGGRGSGCDVLDLGVVPTPLLYFATRYQGETSGAMVTASHNPEEYNGLKVVIGGHSLAGERVAALRERILNGDFTRGSGQYRAGDLVDDYIGHIKRDVTVARTLKVVVDCGNAAASAVAPDLYRALDCQLVELNCNPDAGFPDGRVPDPTRPESLAAVQHAVVAQGADLGLAFDGDGDRLGVIDSAGKIIWPDRLLMLMAADVLSRHPGTDVVFDVKCSHHLATEVLRNGGRPVMWRSGHSPLKAKLHETGALLAGEWSGHIMFRERWYGFDDALYAGARLLEVLAFDPRPSSEVFAALPEAVGTEELILPLHEGESTRIMTAVMEHAPRLGGVDLNSVDGLRVEFEHGWGLVRASNTQPALMFRFEGDDETELERIQELFRRLMNRAAPELKLPF